MCVYARGSSFTCMRWISGDNQQWYNSQDARAFSSKKGVTTALTADEVNKLH